MPSLREPMSANTENPLPSTPDRTPLGVAALALAAGAAVGTHGLAPTGTTVLDVAVVVVAVAGWVWLASLAPLRMLVIGTAVSTGLAGSAWAFCVGVAAVTLGLLWWRSGDGTQLQRAVIAAALAQVLAQLRSLGTFGISSAVGLALALAVAVVAWGRQPDDQRRRSKHIVLAIGGLGLACVIGFGVTAATAGSRLLNGGREARAALRLVDQGELDAALDGFANASRLLNSAEDSLGAWWGVPARAVPLVAQQRRSVRRLAQEAAAATEQIAAILERTDYDALDVVGGRINLEAIRALDAPLRDLDSAMGDLAERTDGARSDWLFPPINGLIKSLSQDITKRRTQLVDVREAVLRAPDMLGASGVRRYFVALTTPAEARGVGGFMGNWAEVTADQGRLTLSGFGRVRDLLAAAPRTPRLTGMPAEYIAQYGAYVLADPATLEVGPGAWQNLTVAPHFPWVAEVIANLYPQSGGSELDGVFVMDVFAVAQLMRITGSVSIPGIGVEITPDNALQYLLRDQYLVENLGDRVDLLETLARTTIDRSLAGALPSPPKLAALMSPMARQHRLAAWARRPEEQAVLRNANMTKELSFGESTNVVGYSLYNGNGNKIDAYLEGSVSYGIETDRRSGDLAGSLTLSLRNTAPAQGLPNYVIGNLVGLPLGTNRLLVTLYSSAPIVSVMSPDADVSWNPGNERGLYTATVTIEIASGATVSLTMEVAGTGTGGPPRRLLVDAPPTAQPLPLTVTHNGKPLTPSPILESGTFGFDL